MMNKCGLDFGECVFDYSWQNDIIPFLSNAFKINEDIVDRRIYLDGIYNMLISYHMKTRETVVEKDAQKRHVSRAMEFIHHNYYKSVKISDIADNLYIDRQYLCNIFRKYAGISPKEYLMQYRINRSQELLKNPALSISEISRSVGYDDMFQFSRIFKKRCGISPTDYRKSIL